MHEPARIRVLKPGWQTTVQDQGRYGYQRYGVPVSGAMDRRSCLIANRLVGNHDEDAAVEITLKGPELLFETASMIALAGADLTPTVDGADIPLWTSIAVRPGSRLVFGSRRSGVRCYLALAGGVDVPAVLGSRSTHLSSRTGGMMGRTLASGDMIRSHLPHDRGHTTTGRSLPEELRPAYTDRTTLRVLPGPHRDFFSEGSFELLCANPYRLSSRSDRMGYRLEGSRLARSATVRFISDATAAGALQVPPDELPILLMADHQTTGGYPVIAVVISADLHLAGQLMPGDLVAFRPTNVADAIAALHREREEMDRAVPPASATST